jgi:uncharacterized protein YjeT (DUF2065 family)
MNSLFLATVIGWFLVIFSLFLILRHEHLRSIMQDIIASPGLFFVFALITLILGLLMVASHNVWTMTWPVIITILGWLVLLSGLIRLVCADVAIKMAREMLDHPLRMQILGGVYLIVGLFLLFHVYYLHA